MQFIFILALLLTTSLTFAQKKFTSQEFASLKWLQGSWKGMAGDKPFYEAWRWVNDSVLVNFVIEIKNNDTLITESGALLLKNGLITLGQKPSQWQATRLMPNEIVLKNDSLPYSNTIVWLHTTDDHWFTILEHPKSTVYYDMRKDAALDRKVSEWLVLQQKKKKN